MLYAALVPVPTRSFTVIVPPDCASVPFALTVSDAVTFNVPPAETVTLAPLVALLFTTSPAIVTVLLMFGYAVASPPGMNAVSPAAGAVPPQFVPLFQLPSFAAPVHVLFASVNVIDARVTLPTTSRPYGPITPGGGGSR